MSVKKLCAKAGCPNFRIEGSSYCEKHDYIRVNYLEKRAEYLSNRPRDWTKYQRTNNYNSPQWRKMSKEFLLEHPFCEICGDKSEVVHHVIPPRGNEELFFDKTNLSAVCKRCHDTVLTPKEIKERKNLKKSNTDID